MDTGGVWNKSKCWGTYQKYSFYRANQHTLTSLNNIYI